MSTALPASTRGTVSLALAGVVVLIAYASLYPFQFDAAGLAQLGRALGSLGIRPSSRGDLLANVLLYAPFGALAALALRQRIERGLAGKRAAGSIVDALTIVAVAALSGLLSASMELLQTLEPHRVPSLTDVAMNVTGALAGAAIVCVVDRAAFSFGSAGHLPRMPIAVVTLWLLGATLPWLPTIDWQKYKDAVKPLVDAPSIDATLTLAELAGWLVVVQALRFIVEPTRRLPVTFCLMAGALLGQVILIDNALSLEEVVGVFGAAALMPWSRGWDRRHAAAGLAVLLGATLVLEGLQPFVFSTGPTSFGWIPLQGTLASGSPLGSLATWIQKLFGYVALAWLLREAGLPYRAAAPLVVGLVAGVEVLQCWVPGRTPEITDPLVAAAVVAYAASSWASYVEGLRQLRTDLN